MGNSFGSVVDTKCTTIMKVSGEKLKLRAPAHVGEILKVYPGYVLFEAEEVKKFGIQTKPLGFHEQLEPGRLYFLVDLPKSLEEMPSPRRARSGTIIMKKSNAEERLERLKQTHNNKSASVTPLPVLSKDGVEVAGGSGGGGVYKRVTVQIPKEEFRKVMRESKDGAEAAKKIMELHNNNVALLSDDHNKDQNCGVKISELEAAQPTRTRERRVSFLAVIEEENRDN